MNSAEVRYRKNFLTNVIFRLDFTSIDEINTKIPGDFWEEFRFEFPHTETQEVIKYITIVKEGKKYDYENHFPLYVFSDSNNEKRVLLANHYLVVEFLKYQDFHSFQGIVHKIGDNFLKLYHPTNFRRLGLRYINQIVLPKGNPLIWNNYVDISLIHVVDKFLKRDPHLSKAMSQIILT